jgi:hypothetical protein
VLEPCCLCKISPTLCNSIGFVKISCPQHIDNFVIAWSEDEAKKAWNVQNKITVFDEIRTEIKKHTCENCGYGCLFLNLYNCSEDKRNHSKFDTCPKWYLKDESAPLPTKYELTDSDEEYNDTYFK